MRTSKNGRFWTSIGAMDAAKAHFAATGEALYKPVPKGPYGTVEARYAALWAEYWNRAMDRLTHKVCPRCSKATDPAECIEVVSIAKERVYVHLDCLYPSDRDASEVAA